MLDAFGHETAAAVDAWGARRGVALALGALAPQLAPSAVPAAMAFFVRRALCDRNDAVRDAMLAAAMALVDLHGKVHPPPYCLNLHSLPNTPLCRSL